MNDNKDRFIREYSYSLQQGVAAIFAGAGLSRESGYVDWKELLRKFAGDIRLDIDKETDLVEIAQYYINEMGGNRNSLNHEILSQFTRNSSENKTLNEISKLPISTYWTTNYDHIIEETLRNKRNRRVDIKVSQENLAINLSDADTTVYKIHGDISEPSKAVITKDDYELFESTHKLFIASLQGDLITKTFAFVGYSFNDPDLSQILSCIRILLGENKRNHYCFIKRIEPQYFKEQNEYTYAVIKQELKIKDMLRYGIHTVLINDYSEIKDIFARVNKTYITNKIFIAGSCRNYGNWKKEKAYEFLYNLGFKLVELGFLLSTGFVEGVGPQIVNGALTAINEKQLQIEKILTIKPLPLIEGKDEHINLVSKKMFQDNMITQVGIVIFLFGNSYYDGTLSSSKGVWHDYQRALEHNKYIIPVGSTSFSSLEIQDDMEKRIDSFPYLKPFLNDLRNEADPNKLVETIIQVINKIRSES